MTRVENPSPPMTVIAMGARISAPWPTGNTLKASRCQAVICFMPSTMALVPNSGVRPEGPWTVMGLCQPPDQVPNIQTYGREP